MNPPTTQPKTQDFANLVDYQQRHTCLSNELAQLEVTINKATDTALGKHTAAYVVLQEGIAELELQIKALFELHPEWREKDKKSLATPYGEVEQRSSTKIEVPNPALTVTLIKARGLAEPSFKSANFLHVEEKPNLEAMEGLEDAELTKLGASRKKSESVTVKPAKVSAAKIAKAAKQPKKEQAVAA